VDAEAGPGALEAGGEVAQLTHLLHLVLQELPLQEVREVRVLLLRRQPPKLPQFSHRCYSFSVYQYLIIQEDCRMPCIEGAGTQA
jgi:hypothetical protein